MPNYSDGLTLKRDITAINYLTQVVPTPVYQRQQTEDINVTEARTRPQRSEPVRRAPEAERARENPPPPQTRNASPPQPRDNLFTGKKIDVFA